MEEFMSITGVVLLGVAVVLAGYSLGTGQTPMLIAGAVFGVCGLFATAIGLIARHVD